MSCHDLRRASDLGREVLLESVQSFGDKDLDSSLFEATLKEVEKGFIQGPISKEELPSRIHLDKTFPSETKEQGSSH